MQGKLPNLVQYHGLFGPQAATLDEMAMLPGCYCQTRAAAIAKVRERRKAAKGLKAAESGQIGQGTHCDATG
jgi:hypothetical protein